jgi:hypothetical protein
MDQLGEASTEDPAGTGTGSPTAELLQQPSQAALLGAPGRTLPEPLQHHGNLVSVLIPRHREQARSAVIEGKPRLIVFPPHGDWGKPIARHMFLQNASMVGSLVISAGSKSSRLASGDERIPVCVETGVLAEYCRKTVDGFVRESAWPIVAPVTARALEHPQAVVVAARLVAERAGDQ